MRELRIGYMLYVRIQEPTPIRCGLWHGVSLLIPLNDREAKQTAFDMAGVLDRMAHIEDAIIDKHRELQEVISMRESLPDTVGHNPYDTAPNKVRGPGENDYWQKCRDGKWWYFRNDERLGAANDYEVHLLEMIGSMKDLAP